jgi:hypothetical protein
MRYDADVSGTLLTGWVVYSIGPTKGVETEERQHSLPATVGASGLVKPDSLSQNEYGFC